MLYPQSRIIVFAKTPEPGTVKTRLIPDYGESFATELHCAMLWHSLTVITQAEICPIELWCSPNINHPFFHSCVDVFNLTLHEQQGENLGEKMRDAFDQVLATANHALIIGTDCPYLLKTDFMSAMNKLIEGVDVVISPAEDGGYVMLGQSIAVPLLFEKIDWGSSSVLAQTIEQIQTAELTSFMLSKKRDVDVADDVKYLAENSQTILLHPRLMTILKSLLL